MPMTQRTHQTSFTSVCQCHSPSLENNDKVFFQVTHIHGFAFVSNIRMFLDEQPTHVGEKEASFSVVRVGVSF